MTFNNIPETPAFNREALFKLSSNIFQFGQVIMKLKLSNINLNSENVTYYLSEMITNNNILQLLDLSWACLNATNLEKITNALICRKQSIRHINFSYNKLNFQADHPELENSQKVIANLKELFEDAKVLCHVRLSGMNISKEELPDLCKEMAQV